jgi:MinD-like ATPase involved in chromosome partitioning or flagellar assembly
MADGIQDASEAILCHSLVVTAWLSQAGRHSVAASRSTSCAAAALGWRTWIIRRDDHVRDAIRRQVLIQVRHPNAAAAQDVERLAATL